MPTACEPVRQCVGGASVFQLGFIVDDDAAWANGGMQMTTRPFDLQFQSTSPFRSISGGGFVGSANFVQRGGQSPALKVAAGVLLPVREGASVRFELVSFPGNLMSITKEFIATIPDPSDPFTLRFIRP